MMRATTGIFWRRSGPRTGGCDEDGRWWAATGSNDETGRRGLETSYDEQVCGDGPRLRGAGTNGWVFYDGDVTTDCDDTTRQPRRAGSRTRSRGGRVWRRAVATGCVDWVRRGLACDGRGRTGGRNPEKMGCRGDGDDGRDARKSRGATIRSLVLFELIIIAKLCESRV